MHIFLFLIILLTYLIVFIPGYIAVNFNTMLIAVLILWIINVIVGFLDAKKNVVYLLFNFTFFTFLISKPTISLFRKEEWWVFDEVNGLFAFKALMLALTFLFVGQAIGIRLLNKEKKKVEAAEVFNAKNIKIISIVLYFISLSAFMILEFEKLVFMKDHTYVDYFSKFASKLPYIIYVISTFMKYSLCMFLVCKPKKKEAFIPLALYVLSAVPQLIIGIRNPIVQNCIFAFLYYCIRDIMGDKEKWFGRIEKTLIVAMVPFILVFLGALNYTRADAEVSKNGFELIIDLFYHQGITFDVLTIGYASIPALPVRPFRNYTFGGFIDYFLHGTIGQLFGGTPLPSGNNMEQALYSNSFAHNMSYVAKGKEYLEGHGWGSSYILETFVDYGYIGVIISSMLIGIFCVYVLKFMKKNKYTFYISLLALTSFFMLPRAEATGWLTFILTAQFWISTIVIVMGSNLCIKTYYHKNLKYIGGKKHV